MQIKRSFSSQVASQWLLSGLLLLKCLGYAHASPSAQLASAPPIRLYALDCGRIEFADLKDFSDTGEYDGKPGWIVVSCFLIRHPKGTLIWELGLGDRLVTAPQPSVGDPPVSVTVKVTLLSQLAQLGIKPSDVTYLAFSHAHSDHTGNANMFTSSTWLLNQNELEWAVSGPRFVVVPHSFSAYKTVKTRIFSGDYDVFGDGSVRILKMPGHTPGHQTLMVTLNKAGIVMLSGDLYHFRADRENRYVMGVNEDRAQTLASFDRFEKLAASTHARVIIQHDPADFAALPKFPAYLE